MDAQLFEMGDPEAEQIRELCKEFRESETERIHRAVADIEGEIQPVRDALTAKFAKKSENRLGVLSRKRDKLLAPSNPRSNMTAIVSIPAMSHR